MSTQGKKAFGTKIYIGDGLSPEGFTKIDEVFDIGPVGGKKPLIDFSNHDDTGSGFNDYLVGDLADGNEIACRANEIPGNTSQNLVRTAYTAESKVGWQIIFANSGATEVFEAVITAYETGLTDQMTGRQYFSWTLKMTSAPVRTT